jgi:hypothetical protein
MIRVRNPAYITQELFRESRAYVFILHVVWLRQSLVFADQLDVFLMDSVGVRFSRHNLRSLAGDKIIALVFPAHTTNLFQALDLLFLSAMKNHKDHLGNERDTGSVPGQISKLVRGYEQTATSFTIQSCF